MILSDKMQSMPLNILSVLDDARRKIVENGGSVINLSVGTPDFAPDKHVMEALSQAALDPLNYKYAISDSTELLDAVITWYARRFNVTLAREQITSVYGSQEGIAHICFPLCNAGDVVLTPDPGYPIFRFGPFLAGATVVPVPLNWENGYLLDLESISPATAHAAKVIIVSYPNNPTTAVATPDFYERLVAFARKYDVIVIHDNAYSELVLGGKPGGSFLSTKGASDVGIEFNSLSKSYNLTGMRMSFALGNPDIIQAFRRLRSQIDYGPFPVAQKAAIAALLGPQDILQRNRDEYSLRRDAICNGLSDIGWAVPKSASTMFTWFPLPKGYSDDVAFTFELLEKTGVICVPGSSFGEMGKGFVRFALTASVEEIHTAVKRIADSGIVCGK